MNTLVNKEEALSLLGKFLDEVEASGYASLVNRIGESDALGVEGTSGSAYQIEYDILWDNKPGGPIRIIGNVDDGGWRAFAPFTESRLVAKPAD